METTYLGSQPHGLLWLCGGKCKLFEVYLVQFVHMSEAACYLSLILLPPPLPPSSDDLLCPKLHREDCANLGSGMLLTSEPFWAASFH